MPETSNIPPPSEDFDFDEEVLAMNDARNTRVLREAKISKLAGMRERKKIAQMKKRNISKDHHSIPGDTTQNTPALRKDAKKRMEYDLSTYAHLVQENGKYWHKDVKHTLRVISYARMIQQARYTDEKPKVQPKRNEGGEIQR